MTDKVQKIREEVERMHNLLPVMDGGNISVNYADRICTTLEMYIDSLQEEPINKDFEMALAEMVDKAQKCVVEPLVVAAQWKDYLIELAKIEEPVSESIDFEQELYKAFGQIKDFTLGIAIAKRFYDIGRKHNEPVSKDLNEAAEGYAVTDEVLPNGKVMINFQVEKAFITGAKWQEEQFEKNRLAACDRQTDEEAEIERDFCMGIIENEHRQPTFDDAIKYGIRLQKEQMMAKAIDAHCFGFQGAALFSFRLPADNYLVGSEVKVIVIKED